MIRELRAIYVKGRGLKGYYKLNNADLLRLLEVPEKTPHIEPIKVGTFKECCRSQWNEFMNWLEEHVPSKPEIINTTIKRINGRPVLSTA